MHSFFVGDHQDSREYHENVCVSNDANPWILSEEFIDESIDSIDETEESIDESEDFINGSIDETVDSIDASMDPAPENRSIRPFCK